MTDFFANWPQGIVEKKKGKKTVEGGRRYDSRTTLETSYCH